MLHYIFLQSLNGFSAFKALPFSEFEAFTNCKKNRIVEGVCEFSTTALIIYAQINKEKYLKKNQLAC